MSTLIPTHCLRFKEFGFALDVPISNVDVGYEKALMPMIRPTDFYQHLADLGKLSILYAEQDTAVLTKCPRLVYSRSLQPSHKIPVYIYIYVYIYM